MHKPPKTRLLYILSPSYSGSTLLTLLLAQHPKIATIGELKATRLGNIETYKCSCGEPILTCTFWSSLKKTTESNNIPFDINNFGTHFASKNRLWNKILGAQVRGRLFEKLRLTLLHQAAGLKRVYGDTLNKNQAFMRMATELQNADIYLDGSKDPQRLLYLQDSGNYEISIIKISRDGRAQSYSQSSKSYYTAGYKAATKEWLYTMEQINRALKHFPKQNILETRYEDLCAHPAETMEKFWQFLNIPTTDQNWNNLDLRTSEHHILGNNMRTKSHIRVSLDEKWRRDLSQQDLETFEKIAGHENKRLGYI